MDVNFLKRILPLEFSTFTPLAHINISIVQKYLSFGARIGNAMGRCQNKTGVNENPRAEIATLRPHDQGHCIFPGVFTAANLVAVRTRSNGVTTNNTTFDDI